MKSMRFDYEEFFVKGTFIVVAACGDIFEADNKENEKVVMTERKFAENTKNK